MTTGTSGGPEVESRAQAMARRIDAGQYSDQSESSRSAPREGEEAQYSQYELDQADIRRAMKERQDFIRKSDERRAALRARLQEMQNSLKSENVPLQRDIQLELQELATDVAGVAHQMDALSDERAKNSARMEKYLNGLAGQYRAPDEIE